MSDLSLPQTETRKPVATWRKIVAAVLDFLSAFFAAGFAIAYLTGNLTNDGFELHGVPAIVALAAVALYFVIFTKFLGGTLWQRLLRVR